MTLKRVRRAAALILSLSLLAPVAALAHDFLGANLNGIADFSRNHEFVDLVRQSRRFGTAADPFNAVIAVGADGWPTGDFGVTLFAAQDAVIGMPGSVFKVVFNGQATVSAAAGGTVTNVVYTAGTNTTTLDYTFTAGAETMALRFQSVPPGNPVKNLKVIRPGFNVATHPTFTPAWLAHVSRFSVLRLMDWMRTNHEANEIVTWADRPTQQKKRTEAEGASVEAIVELANAVNRDIWINIPVRASDEYVTNLATQLRDQLNPGVRVWVEYSNELWNAAFPQFQIQKDLAIAEVNANPSSVLRFDGTNDQNQWAFRRVGKRLKEVSDIFKTVWGPSAFSARVRPILAGQQANSFIVEQGLEVVDVGMNVRPNTVFYALSGAPYIFPSATNDANEDEAPGLTAQDILTKIGQGVANAPNVNSYQYQSHVALGAWYGLKVVAYEGGFDTFGSANIPAKRAANLDPQILPHCRNLLDTWHAQGFEHFLWFNAGADNYNIPFGQWPLREDMGGPSPPKNQCIDATIAAPLPALTAGTPVTAPIAGGSFIGSSSPTGSITNASAPFGFPGFAQYLVRATTPGIHRLTFNVTNSDSAKIGVQVNGATVTSSHNLPNAGSAPVASAPVSVMLRRGVNALRFTRPASAGSWTIPTFVLDSLAMVKADFTGDGKADMLWRNSSTGQVFALPMNGLAAGAGAIVYQEASPAWKIIAQADLDGDDQADIIWYNASTGQVFALLMDGASVAASGMIYFEPDTSWRVVGVGDFNGDGKADLLWRNLNSGLVYVALMNGLNTAGGGVIYSEPSPAWQVQHVADFNGDGKADILWRNTSTGQVFVMFVNGLATAGGGFAYVEPNASWQIIAAADYNGDGKADLLWRNVATGQVFMMLMDGFTVASSAMAYTEPNLQWTIVASADYNGDGKADLLWRNSASGQVFMMQMDGFAIGPSAVVYTEPNQDWKVQAP